MVNVLARSIPAPIHFKSLWGDYRGRARLVGADEPGRVVVLLRSVLVRNGCPLKPKRRTPAPWASIPRHAHASNVFPVSHASLPKYLARFS